MVPIKKVLQIYSEDVVYTLFLETIPTRFCWLNCRKQKLVQSINIVARTICSGIVTSLSTGFCSILNVYFNDTQLYRWLWLVHKKNSLDKFPVMATNNWIVLVVGRSSKNFFAPNSLIFWKSCSKEEKEEGKKAIVKRYTFQEKAKK